MLIYFFLLLLKENLYTFIKAKSMLREMMYFSRLIIIKSIKKGFLC